MKTSVLKCVSAIVVSLSLSQFANAGFLSALIDNGGGGQSLYNFDSGNLFGGTTVAISGLGVDSLLGIDYRPRTGQLYGLSSGNAVYTINTTTGAATQVGAGFAGSPLTGAVFGFDFNPTIDRIRVVSNTGQNRVVHPDTGLITVTGTPVAYLPGDVNVGVTPVLAHHAYDNNTFGLVAPATSQLYAIDVALNVLVRQANNLGTLATVGNLGIDVPDTGFGGFDIAQEGTTLTGIAAFHDGVSPTSNLFSIDLATGAAVPLGSITGSVRGLSATAVPEPGTFAVLGLVMGGFIVRYRRKRRSQGVPGLV